MARLSGEYVQLEHPFVPCSLPNPTSVSSSHQITRLHHRSRRSQYRFVKEESLRSVLLTRLAAALLLLAVLRGEVDDGLAGARLVLTRLAGIKSLAGDDAVNFWDRVKFVSFGHVKSRAPPSPTCEDVLESKLDIAGIKSGGFDEREVVFACQRSALDCRVITVFGDHKTY